MTVYLVGAGPGDPGLLTVRGAEVLAGADVVVHDRLASSALLDLAPPAATRISVGKTPRGPSTPQDEINRLLVELGTAGRAVVRLKGGDPFVFARGGEEAAALAAAGVPFEVVPGISSAIAVPAYAGVPVTMRNVATSFTVVTGHGDPWADTETDWGAVAGIAVSGGTVVVLMGVATRGEIAARLVAGGLPGTTPVAAVRWGTRPEQQTVRTTLAGLGEAAVGSPSVIVIGAVAGLDLAWFEARPLFGRTIVVTRARAQASGLVARLQRLGATTVELPTIQIADPADGGSALAAAAATVAGVDWVVFTSVNAVDRFLALLRDARALGAARVAAVGPGTAEALDRHRVVADLVPPRALAESLVESFPAGPGRVLLPQAAAARPTVAEGLAAAGWQVEVVEAYRTEPAVPPAAALAEAAAADAITFTSASTVAGHVAAAGTAGLPPVVASIGPVTTAAAEAAGIPVTVEAAPHTVEGLVDALVRVLGRPATG
jgi:uroporphyrinogen III methyltransferase/synthase